MVTTSALIAVASVLTAFRITQSIGYSVCVGLMALEQSVQPI
ncbi:hypothetical protein KPSA1_03883 [Pseudomonas syringae pv. actinidiae]|uniref:Uncharacterized protein n=1 Tax=Pseudomonas syringae pv. actinidiae TaxID=103796 RepID=A0A2V0QJH1_PSESF|nr:hypothetical protein KPSA1_03883 [Pseudomonas syringae pv. actinidiae]